MALADTGYWLALANPQDQWHKAAIAATQDLEDDLVVTWPVITETCHLMLARLGLQAQLRFVERISRNAVIHDISSDKLPMIGSLMEKYADLPMDMADASLVVAATDLKDGRILTTDQRDFGAYQWKTAKPFDNLLLNR